MRSGQSVIAVRQVRFDDSVALGTLVLEAVYEAPSSGHGPEDLAEDALIVGGDLAEACREGRELVLVAELGGSLAGVARVRQRPLVRSRHVADLEVLVHPAARRCGVGTALIREAIGQADRRPDVRKMSTRVAEDDEGLRAALARTGRWRRERVETLALFRDGALHHWEVWSLGVA